MYMNSHTTVNHHVNKYPSNPRLQERSGRLQERSAGARTQSWQLGLEAENSGDVWKAVGNFLAASGGRVVLESCWKHPEKLGEALGTTLGASCALLKSCWKLVGDS